VCISESFYCLHLIILLSALQLSVKRFGLHKYICKVLSILNKVGMVGTLQQDDIWGHSGVSLYKRGGNMSGQMILSCYVPYLIKGEAENKCSKNV